MPVAPAMPSVQSFFASNLEDKGQPEPKDALSPGNTEVAVKRDQLLNGPTLPMLWFQYPELCEFQLLGRPRRTKEGDLKVRTQRVVEGGQTRSAKLPKATPLNVAEKGTFLLLIGSILPISQLQYPRP